MITRGFRNIRLRRGVAGAAALLVIAGGVAFALLQSQAGLTGNAIQTDSAGLWISRDGASYSSSTSGYDFVHVIPGSQPSQTEHFQLQNVGSAALSLRLAMPGAPDDQDGVDLGKVSVILTPHDTGAAPGASQSFTLQSLLDAPDGVPLDAAALGSGTTEGFDIQIAMDADAVDGQGTALSGVDLTFTGVATAAD